MDFQIQRVDKSWGCEIWFANDPQRDYCGKELLVHSGHMCSLHRHPRKDEVFYLLEGALLVEWTYHPQGHELQSHKMAPGDRFHVPSGMWHRFTSLTLPPDFSRIIEVSTFHSDDDVERLAPGGLRSA